jgi:hypothetical protein
MAAPAGSTEGRPAGAARSGNILKERYRLVRPIFGDSRAGTWTAHDEVLHRTVLMRLLHLAPGDTATRERFGREALGVARLSHPGIVAVYDTIIEATTTGLVLEHVQATPLSRFLHDGGSVSPTEAVSIALQVADALEAAHSSGVQHRNLSADSVWLCGDQRVKITDFGTVWQGATGEPQPRGATVRQETSDVHALALLLRDCLDAATTDERTPEPPADIVDRVLALGEGDGPTSIAELRAELAGANGPATVPVRPWVDLPPATLEEAEPVDRPSPGTQRRRRRGRLAPLLAAAAIGAVALGVALLTGGDEPSVVRISPVPTSAAPVDTPAPDGDARPAVPAETGRNNAEVAGDPVTDGPVTDDATGDPTAEPDPGVAIVDVRITTFRSDRQPVDDADVLRILDGDESTYWATPGLSAGDATVNGVGLEFQLAETTAVGRMSITSDTEGWVVAAYSGEGGYGQLSDWGLLIDQQANTTGHMLLDLAGEQTDSVLLWIPDPRSALTDEIRIAEVVISADSGAEVR